MTPLERRQPLVPPGRIVVAAAGLGAEQRLEFRQLPGGHLPAREPDLPVEAVLAAHAVDGGQLVDERVPAQPPGARLGAREPHAVDPVLLPGADPDGGPAANEGDRVGLGVAQGHQPEQRVGAGRRVEGAVVGQHGGGRHGVALLLDRDAEDVAPFGRGRRPAGVGLENQEPAVALRREDPGRARLESRRDQRVADDRAQELGGGQVDRPRQRDDVTERRLRVRVARPDVGRQQAAVARPGPPATTRAAVASTAPASAAPAGETCLNDAAAGVPVASSASRTSSNAFSASR